MAIKRTQLDFLGARLPPPQAMKRSTEGRLVQKMAIDSRADGCPFPWVLINLPKQQQSRKRIRSRTPGAIGRNTPKQCATQLSLSKAFSRIRKPSLVGAAGQRLMTASHDGQCPAMEIDGPEARAVLA